MKFANFTSIFLPVVLCASACGARTYSIAINDTAEAGTKGAPFEVVVYSDFQCPYCRAAAMAFNAFLEKNPTQLHLYFKHFPLRQHPFAEKAAAAAEAARLQGKFWQMHDLIFNNQTSLSDESFMEYAGMLGLDVERFHKDMRSDAVAARIASDRAEGEALGLDGTPFLVVNGARYNGSFYDLIQDIARHPSP